MDTIHVRISIVGGGLSGWLAACALSQLGVRVTLVAEKGANDPRTTAVSEGSRLFLETLGVWDCVQESASSIQKICIKNGNAETFFAPKPDEHNALGYIIPNTVLLDAFKKQSQNVRVIHDYVTGYQQTECGMTCVLQNHDNVAADLLLAADGKNSALRAQAGIETIDYNYNQNAVVFQIAHEKQHDNTAWELFLDNSIFATLPMAGNTSAVVWSLPTDAAASFVQADSDCQALFVQQAMQHMLGDIKILDTAKSWPLRAKVARNAVCGRMLLLGEAWHSLHPIAGQGWNVTVRDVEGLVNHVKAMQGNGLPIWQGLDQYAAARQSDILAMLANTHGLTKLFGMPVAPVKRMTQAGIHIMNRFPKMGQAAANHAMGFSKLSRLGAKAN